MTKSNPTETGVALNSLELHSNPTGLEPHPLFDDRTRTVPWMTRTLHRLYDQEAQKVLGVRQISIAHWYYLRALAQSGELNQLELSRRIGIASTTAVPALDSLEKRGLVKRTRDPKDRRKYYVSLTGDGRDLVEQLMPEIVRMICASFDGIDSEALLVFWNVLLQIEHNLEAIANGNSVD